MENPTSIELYSKFLEICGPWKVDKVEQDQSTKQIHVFIGYDDKSNEIVCPVCGRAGKIHDHRIRRMRHLDTCDYQTILEVRVPQVECVEHKVQQISPSFAEKTEDVAVYGIKFIIYIQSLVSKIE